MTTYTELDNLRIGAELKEFKKSARAFGRLVQDEQTDRAALLRLGAERVTAFADGYAAGQGRPSAVGNMVISIANLGSPVLAYAKHNPEPALILAYEEFGRAYLQDLYRMAGAERATRSISEGLLKTCLSHALNFARFEFVSADFRRAAFDHGLSTSRALMLDNTSKAKLAGDILDSRAASPEQRVNSLALLYGATRGCLTIRADKDRLDRIRCHTTAAPSPDAAHLVENAARRDNLQEELRYFDEPLRRVGEARLLTILIKHAVPAPQRR